MKTIIILNHIPMRRKMSFIILLSFMVWFNQEIGFAQLPQKVDTNSIIRKVPERRTIEITLPEANKDQERKERIDHEDIKLLPDVFPHPDSPEGIKLARERTQKKIIPVCSTIQTVLNKTMNKFLISISENNEEGFNNVFKKSISDELQLRDEEFKHFRRTLFNNLVNEFKTADINIINYTFAVTNLNDNQNIMEAIMIDKDGIETTGFILELHNGNWVITKVGY